MTYSNARINAEDIAIRKSIKKYMTLGPIIAQGSNSPITLHDCDTDMFRAFWSLLAETMIASGELSRFDKEQISTMVSKANECRICLTAHAMMKSAAMMKASRGKDDDESETTKSEEEARSDESLRYAENVLKASKEGLELDSLVDNEYAILSPDCKAEIALLVLLKNHMNRCVMAIIGEQMSTAMFAVPRPVAKGMESKRFMSVVNKIAAPVLRGGMKKNRKPGITNELFEGSSEARITSLPIHLQGVSLAGKERATALTRFHQEVEQAYLTRHYKKISKEALRFIDDEVISDKLSKEKVSPMAVVIWLQDKVQVLENENDRIVATALLLTYHFPSRLHQSKVWKEFVALMGNVKDARAAVIWFSARLTLKDAKGLHVEDLLFL